MLRSRGTIADMESDTPTPPAPRRGRYAEAARNDGAILDAAREVFVDDPTAPIAEVARRAGVGIGALYHRYASKEQLLGTLCAVGQDLYLAETERALADDGDPWQAYVTWLERIVDADTHSLTVALAGTFTPDDGHRERTVRMVDLAGRLFARTRESGRLRADVTELDVALLLETIAGARLGDRTRTAELRRRQLALLVDGLCTPDPHPLPSTPPTWEEQESRWSPA
jgi:AcrR family transcriptional regulator